MSKIPLAGRSSLLLLTLLLPTLVHAQAPPLTLQSPNAEPLGSFSYALSGVPDADGDGRDDLLIGASSEDIDGDSYPYNGDQGRVYLFSDATGVLLRTLTSPNLEQLGYFGRSVSGVPDADGDGRGDLLIGASGENGGTINAGRAYLFSGTTGALLRTLQSPNPEANGSFGLDVSGVPDTDGDGRGDLLIRADEAADAGRVYLFSGATGALLRTLQSPNPEPSGFFGGSVSGMSDTDGDGRGDLLVGAGEQHNGLSDAGRAYLFSGATGALLRTLQSPSPEQYGGFGASVSGVPDVNGDGRTDLLIGTDAEDGAVEDAGRAYLFSGATGALLHTLQSPNPNDPRDVAGGFGRRVSGVADVNGDGRGDLLISAYNESSGSRQNVGRAYLFSGASGALLRTLQSPNPEQSGNFGLSVSGVADANGDGRGDLLVGAWHENGGVLDSGQAYLFPSGTSSGITLSASGSPATISPGDVVTVTATISNTNVYSVSLDLVIVARRGGNPVLTRPVGSVTVPAGTTVTQSFGLTSPRNTPPGTYTVVVNAGDIGDILNTVYASDAFDVTVTAAPLLSGTPATEPFAVSPLSGDGSTSAAFASSAMPSSVSASPNPFSGQTVLRFALAEASPVQLSVYDVLGREVAVLVEGEAAAGAHMAVFDGRGLASGVYVWRLAASGAVQTGRLTLLE